MTQGLQEIVILYCDIDTLSQEQIQHMAEFVSPERKRRIRPTMSRQKGLQHLVAGYLLELYLQQHGYPAAFHYKKHASGKPYLVFEDGSKAPHFSLTHSGSKVACAISPRSVGIDIEDKSFDDEDGRHRKRLARIADRFFTEEEQVYLTYYPQEFYRVWTFKEAVAKAYNEPIMDVLQQWDYRNVLEKIQDVDLSQGEEVEDHIFLVKTSIQLERECTSTMEGAKSFNSETGFAGFRRLVGADFVGFLVDKEIKDR
jgi:phosphopantetheinyl transferase